jgi:hypothetical protein
MAGQHRIRVTALVDAPLHALFSNTVGGGRGGVPHKDADEDLDIESDGAEDMFGAPQFTGATSRNLVVCSSACSLCISRVFHSGGLNPIASVHY